MTTLYNQCSFSFISLVFVFSISCSPEVINSDTLDNQTSTVTDKDGNIYNKVTIGTQVWMKENLKTTKYSDGTSIPLVTSNSTWNSQTTSGYCWYNSNETTYKNLYGAIYNWYAVKTSKLCPTGWHVPSDAEWSTLVSYLGGDLLAGGKLKEIGTSHWISPNAGISNTLGFTALPGGWRDISGTFYDIGTYGNWWSSTEYDTNNALYRYICNDDNDVERDYDLKRYGFSVRCLKD